MSIILLYPGSHRFDIFIICNFFFYENVGIYFIEPQQAKKAINNMGQEQWRGQMSSLKFWKKASR